MNHSISHRSSTQNLLSNLKRTAVVALAVPLVLGLAGCGKGIQKDLEVSNTSFVQMGTKWRFQGTVTNTGNKSYSQIFVVIDLMEGDEVFKQISTTANVPSGYKLEPGKSTSFHQDFDDGGYKPNNHKIVRLYTTG